MTDSALLEVNNLSVEFPTDDGALPALCDVSFSLAGGERLGIVGESGAGKSLAAAALINLIPPPGVITDGEVMFDKQDLLSLTSDEIREVRGQTIASVFQDPMTTLNPTLTIGRQLTECLEAHNIASGQKAKELAVERLREVSIPSPESRLDAYPLELSGGMRQRAVIAAALICNPKLIIADEPTTALDVTTQADIMALLSTLCHNRKMALLLISHDLALVSQMTDNIIVMYAGRIVEQAPSHQLIASPKHPYAKGLLASLMERKRGYFSQIPGNMPSLSDIPNGCAFHPRCENAKVNCQNQTPELQSEHGHKVACFFPHHYKT